MDEKRPEDLLPIPEEPDLGGGAHREEEVWDFLREDLPEEGGADASRADPPTRPEGEEPTRQREGGAKKGRRERTASASDGWQAFCSKAGPLIKEWGGKAWAGLKIAGRYLALFLAFAGAKLWQFLKFAGRKTWQFLKFAGRKSWQFLKFAGRNIRRFLLFAGAKIRQFLKFAGRNIWRFLKFLGRHLRAWAIANFALEPAKALGVLLDGLVLKNPALVLLMGVCALLGATSTLRGALGLGLTATAVLLCAEMTLAFLRSIVPERLRVLCSLVVTALFVTLADWGLEVWQRELWQQLGIFVPLLAVNWIILTRLNEFSCRHIPGYAAVDGLGTGLGFTLALCLVGSIREILGTGALWGVPLFGGETAPAPGFAAPYGGFLALAFVLAGAQLVKNLAERRGRA